MGLFKKKTGIFADVIRCDETSYLIWKWHPNGTKEGETERENSIRWGSSLRVKDVEVAVFVYKQKNGTMQDYIVGPYDEKIKTSNFPVLSGILGAFMGGDTPFQAEIYFINLAEIIQTKFAVPYFDVFDNRYPEFSVPVAVRGTISFRIDDYEYFIKLHRLNTFNIDDFYSQIKHAVSRYVKSIVTNIPTIENIPVIQLENKTAIINDSVEKDISKRLQGQFGVEVTGVDIGVIDIDKTSVGYNKLMSITREITIAKTAADLENYEETLRIQREEGQYAMHKQTQSTNLNAFQIEKQAEVGIAGADALGKMGANNAGNIDLGNNSGFNPVQMMAGMALGGAVGQNIATVMNGTMYGGTASAPPPIPTRAYNVAVNGTATGPYDVVRLTQMAQAGELLPDSLVWTQGMATWQKAEEINELKGIFPPPII
ncbi:MAG: SPFH domain-containing protein [Clostridia bacterium]|nr:SPFH domain-containing protein [Clostridia bacterium]